ncbi:cation:proton antiporter regulatory subunit [Agromyces neolithicus]|uniref:Cation:proton antiporter regulatory subunit n=1 Tax=Agromyces neolithicus TaxID=269420 RepID=A0ABN2M5N3_9MICO
MVEVRRVALPGVGVMHSFTTVDGVELAVVAHRTGSSDVVMRHGDDDRHASTLRLEEDEAYTLADLLGGTRVVESIAELEHLPGVPIHWFTVDHDDAIAGRALGEVPDVEGVALVAVVRGDHAHSAPTADFVMAEGDSLVAAGPVPAIREIFRAMREGDTLVDPRDATPAESSDA